MEHRFRRPGYTLGIEEELMIVDGDESHALVNGIESLLGKTQDGEIKPELMECMLELATLPSADLAHAEARLRALRRDAGSAANRHGWALAAAGTHPAAEWEDQQIVERERYRNIVHALAFVARQELIFGMHVHVGIDDPEKAIHVVNGMREHVPVLAGLAANSPFWRGRATGLMSTRIPVFRSFPRVGIPPYYASWDDYQRRIAAMVDAGMIEDYTFLWYDVRPHPKFGTIEVRAMDVQTRVEDTIALAALVLALVHELGEGYERGERVAELPFELLDENKWLAARHGLEAVLFDFESSASIPLRELTERLIARLHDHAVELGCAAALGSIRDVLSRGNGASAQVENGDDMRRLLARLVAETAGTERAAVQ
jgi:carboxylate-amine ligase